jgi:choice-of-anchor C domain-containing protein
LVAALLVVAMLSPGAWANLVVNGSFEEATVDPGVGFITLQPGSGAITGWTVINGNPSIDYVGTLFNASDGVRSVDLNGNNGAGGIQQTIATIPGALYQLSFDLAGNPGNPGQEPPNTVRKLFVTAGSVSSQPFEFDTKGPRPFQDLGWRAESLTFQALGTSTTLQFQSGTTDNCCWGPEIDNVKVVPLPSPGEGLLDLGDTNVWLGLRNSDDVGLRLDLQAEVFLNTANPESLVGTGHLNNVPGGSSGFNNAFLRTIPLDLTDGPVPLPPGTKLLFKFSVRRTCFGPGHASGWARFWYNGKRIDTGPTRDAGTRFGAIIQEEDMVFDVTFYLRTGFVLSEESGMSRAFIDKFVNSSEPCPDRTFTPVGTWTFTVPGPQ